MADAGADTVTRTLQAAVEGDPQAAVHLLPLVYDELLKLARARLAKLAPGQTVGATSLVHEAYLRLVGKEDPGWSHRGHFFGAAALAMRNILVDQARQRAALKRGGGRKRVEMVEPVWTDPSGSDTLAINEAVRKLEAEDARKGQIVNLRFFAGLTEEETANALGVSRDTVKREWRYIKRWLFCVLRDDRHP